MTPEEIAAKEAADKAAADKEPADKSEADRIAAEKAKSEESKLFSQADLDRIVRERVADEKKRNEKRIEDEKKAAEEARLKNAGEYKIIAEQKEAELQQLRDDLAKKERDTVRARVAASVFTDTAKAAVVAPLLMGETEEEMATHAKTLLKTFSTASPDPRFGKQGGTSAPKDLFTQIREKAAETIKPQTGPSLEDRLHIAPVR